MKKTTAEQRARSAERIARMADRGKDISKYFTGGKMVYPAQRVNVDFTPKMVGELDTAARELNISRQAVIKTLVRQALDHHYLAMNAQRPSKAA